MGHPANESIGRTMQIERVLQIFALAITVVQQAHPQQPAENSWSPAKYHDLTVGVSTRDDVIRELGKPKAIGKEQDTGLPTMSYTVTDPVLGTLVVYIEKGVLDGMTLSPKKQLTKKNIVGLFGSDYITVRYAPDDCLTNDGSAPIYESPQGSIVHMEYRQLGLAINFRNDQADAIIFTYGPFGPVHSICAARAKKKPAGGASPHK